MPKTEEKMRTFSTRDLYLASTLVTLKIPLLGIDYQIEGLKPKPIGYFNFEETTELLEVRKQYNQSNILVEPKMFVTNMQSLKAEVVNMHQNPNYKERI